MCPGYRQTPAAFHELDTVVRKPMLDLLLQEPNKATSQAKPLILRYRPPSIHGLSLDYIQYE
jgi:hypothetical protein